MSRRRIDVLGVQVDPYPTIEALHHDLHRLIDQQQHALVLNVNAHALNLAYEQPWLRDLFNRAEICFCDGKGVMLAARLLGERIPINIGYGYWIWQLSAFLQAAGYSLYLLGGKPGIAERAADRLRAVYPDLQIVGTHHGYFEKSPQSSECQAVIQHINAARPQVLLVCFGMPLQEQWLADHWDQIDAQIALTGGAALDYTAGVVPRSPRWMSHIGMEWFWRMAVEPRRLWKRYLVGNPQFLLRVLRYRSGRRAAQRGGAPSSSG